MAFSWRARDDAHSPEPKRLPWKDYAPPEAQAVDKMIAHFRLRDPILQPRTESEVMPNGNWGPRTGATQSEHSSHDIRPPSATEANRLDDIATLVRLLTYGEMMDLAAALWQMRPEGKEITAQDLPGMWHSWAKEDSK